MKNAELIEDTKKRRGSVRKSVTNIKANFIGRNSSVGEKKKISFSDNKPFFSPTGLSLTSAGKKKKRNFFGYSQKKNLDKEMKKNNSMGNIDFNHSYASFMMFPKYSAKNKNKPNLKNGAFRKNKSQRPLSVSFAANSTKIGGRSKKTSFFISKKNKKRIKPKLNLNQYNNN